MIKLLFSPPPQTTVSSDPAISPRSIPPDRFIEQYALRQALLPAVPRSRSELYPEEARFNCRHEELSRARAAKHPWLRDSQAYGPLSAAGVPRPPGTSGGGIPRRGGGWRGAAERLAFLHVTSP